MPVLDGGRPLAIKAKKMYKKTRVKGSSIRINKSEPGESIEAKVRRILRQGEPISDGAPIIYTDEKDEILPQYNIRTDRFELAVEATDAISRGKLAKKEAAPNLETEKPGEANPAPGPETKE